MKCHCCGGTEQVSMDKSFGYFLCVLCRRQWIRANTKIDPEMPRRMRNKKAAV